MTRHIAVLLQIYSSYKKPHGVFKGIKDYAEEQGNWQLTVGEYPELMAASGHRFDGAVGSISAEAVAATWGDTVPAVSIDTGMPGKERIPTVHTDFRAVGRMVAEHLIARGFRRLAKIGFGRNIGSLMHFEGMLAVARQHGYPCTRHSVSSRYDGSRENRVRFVEKVKGFQTDWEAPIGVSVQSDALCRCVASVLLDMGWRIPEELATVSTGNHEVICTIVEPTLSSVDLGFHHCGYEAAALLDRLMQGEPPPDDALCTPPKELIVRQSSDVFAVSDPKVAQALRYMADNAADRPSVSDVAQVVSLGRRTLEQRFKQHVGRTINEELIRLRVETLKRLLVESDEPAKTLGAEAGFATTVNMHTMFKRLTGMTPKEYRNEHGS